MELRDQKQVNRFIYLVLKKLISVGILISYLFNINISVR